MSAAINRLDGRVVSLRNLGPVALVEIDSGFPLKGYLLVPQARAMNIGAGRTVTIEIAAHAIHVMRE